MPAKKSGAAGEPLHGIAAVLLLGVMVVLATAHAQTSPTPATVFNSARTRLLADIHRQPRYTCVQNISRRMYRATFPEKQSCASVIAAFEAQKQKPPLSSWDRLRLDVAIADNHEIHSWPGAPRFSDDEIRRFLGPGAFGSGDFGIFLTGIFGGSATVKFQGERTSDGRTLFEYRYEVPQRVSGYHAETGAGFVVTAYDGSFSLDAQTSDLVELAVRTAELPESTHMCQARSHIEYTRLDIHGHDVLLPRETTLQVIDPLAGKALTPSRTPAAVNTAARVFCGSTMRWLARLRSRRRLPRRLQIRYPRGLPLTAGSLPRSIPATAAAGDAIEAVLRSPIRGKGKIVLAPRGARVRGRLVRFVDHPNPLGYFEIGVRLDSVEVNGAELPLYATLATEPQPPTPAREWFHELDVTSLPADSPPNVGTFFFSKAHLQLRRLDAAWVTTSPEGLRENEAEQAARKQARLGLKETIMKFMLALEFSKQATDMLNATPHDAPADYPNLQSILAYDRQAIEAGKAADVGVLNQLYPGLGDEFSYAFVEATALFVHGCETQSNDELQRSHFLNDEWTGWYEAHRKEIEEAVNLRNTE